MQTKAINGYRFLVWVMLLNFLYGVKYNNNTIMSVFSKIDKEILFILVGLITLILLVSFIIYQFALPSQLNVQDLTGGMQTQKK